MLGSGSSQTELGLKCEQAEACTLGLCESVMYAGEAEHACEAGEKDRGRSRHVKEKDSLTPESGSSLSSVENQGFQHN